MKKAEQTIKEKILAEYKKGNIVVSTFEGLMTMPLKECIKQPDSGLLYDLNRDAATILTFIDDPKWINDYALSMVVIELKKQINDSSLRTSKLEELVGLYEESDTHMFLQRRNYQPNISIREVKKEQKLRKQISELRKELGI